MNTIQSYWDGYYESILKPAGVVKGSAQYIETRRGFYAGAHAFLQISLALGEPSVSEAAANAILSGVSAEISMFVSQVGKGGF